MDFLPVPDELTASETLYARAHRNTMDTEVRTFSALLETLAELWLIELSGLDWNASLKEHSLKSALWPKSVRLYEPATIAGLKARIKFLLNHPPLGIPPKAVHTRANRNQCYFHDLFALVWLIEERLRTNQNVIFLSSGGAYLESQENSYPIKNGREVLLFIGCLLDGQEYE